MANLSRVQFPEVRPADPRPDVRVVRDIRMQVSVVRVLLDEVDDSCSPEDGTREQFIEELARLGCRLLETASAMSTDPKTNS